MPRKKSVALADPSAPQQMRLEVFAPDTAHRGASRQSRELSSWNPFPGSADTDLLAELQTLVSRSRDLARNHGVAAGAGLTLRDNVVGTGPRLAATPDYRALGRTAEWATEWARNVEALWRGWADTEDFDASGRLTFAAMTAKVWNAAFWNGEALALPVWLPRRAKSATRIWHIESDRLSTPTAESFNTNIRDGVEINEYGMPVAYYIQKSHPGERFDYGYKQEWERIPATMPWGRRRVLHIFEDDRPGQSRGKPMLSAVLEQFSMLDKYQRTEIQSAIVSAMVAAFVETPMDASAIAELMGGDPNGYLQNKNEWNVALRGASVIPLYPGDKLQPFNPSRPNSAYDKFVENLVRHIGVSIGLPYELLMKDFSKTNYSSARASLLEAFRFFTNRRKFLEQQWANQVYRLWLEEQVNLGNVEAPGFYSNVAAWARASWIWPGRGWIDPVKEANASKIRMDAGISTLKDECAEQGLDWEEVLDQRKREFDAAKERGLEAIFFPQTVAKEQADRQLDIAEDSSQQADSQDSGSDSEDN